MSFGMLIHSVGDATHTSARADGRVVSSSISKVLVTLMMFAGFVRGQTSSTNKSSFSTKMVVPSVGCLVGAYTTGHTSWLFMAMVMFPSFMCSQGSSTDKASITAKMMIRSCCLIPDTTSHGIRLTVTMVMLLNIISS